MAKFEVPTGWTVQAFQFALDLILGNHELAELVGMPIQKNGLSLNMLFRLGVIQAYGLAEAEVRKHHRQMRVMS